MDWDDLRYLLALRRKGSLAAAARVLHVDQTTVGRRLTALEERLGSRLFERHATGHRLTATGLRACELGRTMEEAAEAIDRELGGRDSAIEGRVRITAPVGFVPVLAGVFAQLRDEHPRLSFDLLVDTVSLDLVRREADIAVRMVKPEQAGLVSRRIGQLPWAPFASDDYLRRRGTPPADLAGHDAIAYDAPLTDSPGGRWLSRNAHAARVVLRTNNVVAALDCAAAGIGIAVAPAFMAVRDARLVRAPRPREIGATPLFLVTHRDVAKIPRVRATLDRLFRFLTEQSTR